MKKVQILLSSYNGEKFLQAQLDSFFTMERFNCCKVLIRDDGSTDGTRAILRKYDSLDNFQIEYGCNMGITKSYWWLLQNSDPSCDYFAMCDQDDIWLSYKISSAIEVLSQQNAKKPLLFASLSKMVDSDLSYLSVSPAPKRGISYYNAMVQNILPGHTQVMNRTLLELLLKQGVSDVHVIDSWFYLAASAVGQIVFLPQTTVLHRLHGRNAASMKSGYLANLAQRIRYIRAGLGNAFSKQLFAFFERYKDLMPEEYRKETQSFFSHQLNFFSRLQYVLSCKAYRQNHEDDLMFKLLYVFGKYKI